MCNCMKSGSIMLIKIKNFLFKIIGNGGQALIAKIMIYLHINNDFILFTTKRAKRNSVNLDYCHNFKNLGDNISPLIVDYVARQRNIQLKKCVRNRKHLYAVGSIITAGPQDCTIWGSGLLNTHILNRLAYRKLDIRAVRGPLTRAILMDQGYEVPEIYGDPAILMPLIYNREEEKKYDVGLVTHFNESVENETENVFHRINIATDDYKHFVGEIKSCKLIISSSLHGIIFSEAYGIPSILLRPQSDILKYFDYYYSTERYQFPILDNLLDYKNVCPPKLPANFKKLQDNLIESFPVDLWD